MKISYQEMEIEDALLENHVEKNERPEDTILEHFQIDDDINCNQLSYNESSMKIHSLLILWVYNEFSQSCD